VEAEAVVLAAEECVLLPEVVVVAIVLAIVLAEAEEEPELVAVAVEALFVLPEVVAVADEAEPEAEAEPVADALFRLRAELACAGVPLAPLMLKLGEKL